MLLDHMLKHFGFKNTTVFAHLPEATHFDVLIVEKVIDSWSRLKQCLKETGTVLFSNRSRESLKDLALNEKITVGRIPMGDPYLTVKWLQTDDFEIEDWLGPILTTERFISAFTKPEDVKIFYQP
jgi:hypothetical protein